MMQESALENELKKMKREASASLKRTYDDILCRVGNNPQNARYTEQNRLLSYYQDWFKKAEDRITAAFETDNVKWPGLVWSEHVRPKLERERPQFIYCDVVELSDVGGADMAKCQTPSGANRDKYNSKVARGGTAAVVGLCTRVAGACMGKSALASGISLAGTFLLVGGVAYCVYTGFTSGKETKLSNIQGKEGFGSSRSQPVQVDLDTLMEEQFKANRAVMLKWLDTLGQYAREALQNAEKRVEMKSGTEELG